MEKHEKPGLLLLVALGGIVGTLSGLFGVGGGIILVPMLMLVLKLEPRIAAGTSVASILPVAVVGGTTYSAQGNVSWPSAVALICGVIAGAQVGSILLSRVSAQLMRWMFVAFLTCVMVSLWFVIPSRGNVAEFTALQFVLLVVLGLIAGILSGLLGVGGGVLVVPMMVLFFGVSDLIAKGTSLIMLIPGSLSGTLGNLRRSNVNIRVALVIGASAGALSPVGVMIAGTISPLISNIAFSVLIAVIIIQMVYTLLRTSKP